MKKYILLSICLLTSGICIHSQSALSLDDYKQQVLNYNQNIQIARQTMAAAEALVKETHTEYLPSVSAAASYSYNFNPLQFSLDGMHGELKAQNWSAGGEITQPVYYGGLISATYNAAKIQQDIAKLSENLSIDHVLYLAETTYWNTAAAGDYLLISQQYLGILNQLYDIVKKRFDDGLISKTDLLKIETSLEEGKFQVSRAQQMLVNNYILLNILMGINDENIIPLSDSLEDSQAIPALLTTDDALMRRPEFLMKEKEIELQQNQGKIDQSEFLPRLGVGASAMYGTPALNLTGETLWSPILFAQFSMPIFEWGKSRQSSNKNKALVISKQLEQSETADNIRKEIRTSVNNMLQSREQTGIADSGLKIAQESLDLHTFSYEEGQVSILDVQSAQMSWLNASLKVIDSRLNYKQATATYRKAISEL